MNKLLQNKFVRYGLTLFIGVALGAIFYPSKTITREETYKMEQQIQRLETEKKFISTFYEKKLDEEVKERREYQEAVSSKTETLKEENFKLKQKVSEKRFKIVRPDGTIEEKWFKDTDTEIVSSVVTKIKSEFTRKVKSIENKWKKTHETRVKKIKESYEKKIAEASKTKVVHTKKEKIEINKRSFGVAVGLTNEKDYFSNVTYDIFGPVFLNLLLETDNNFVEKKGGIGIGIRF